MSSLTYSEKFNYYLSLFLKEIINIFPEFKDTIANNYQELLDLGDKQCNSDTYVKYYMDVIKPYHSDIAKKNDKIFKGLEEVKLLQDLDFRNLWSKDINDNTRENIWKYLQTLIVIGKKIIGNDEELDDMLNKFTKISTSEENAPNSENDGNNVESSEQPEDEMLNMLKNMSTMTQNPDEDFPDTSEGEMKNLFEGGIISDIAKELTSELDINNLDIGEPKNMNEAFSNLMGGGQNNFFNLITKVGEKIQRKVESGEVQQGDLMKEATKMMGGLKNPEKIANIMKNKQQQQGGATRDRLRKKLEERKNKEGSN